MEGKKSFPEEVLTELRSEGRIGSNWATECAGGRKGLRGGESAMFEDPYEKRVRPKRERGR